METLSVEDFEEEISKEAPNESGAEIKTWAIAAIQHFNQEYEQLLEKHTSARGQVVIKNLAGLKNAMEQSINGCLTDQGLPDQEKRSSIKNAIESYIEKRDRLLATLD